ncbi:hypothetical protein HK096_007254, partial [Nowakowskiella sp. JEL0078]
MSIAKILWIKSNLPDVYRSAGHFMELPDFLTFKATGSPTRSICSLVCKWTFNPDSKSWDDEFLRMAGFADVVESGYKKWLPLQTNAILLGGQPVGNGLCPQALKDFGFKSNAIVAVGGAIIDAYAGALGTIGSKLNKSTVIEEVQKRMALICGTSSCHIILNRTRILVKGVWGPYKNAIIPGYYATEGGQSATGKLIDHIISMHPCSQDIKTKCSNIFEYLNKLLFEIEKESQMPMAFLTSGIHIQPDFHGNRSPIANSSITGMISGLTLDHSERSLAITYLATLQSLAYETKYIIDTINQGGHCISELFMSGGMAKNDLLTQIISDICQMKVIIPKFIDEAVILGSAICGATAAELSVISDYSEEDLTRILCGNMVSMAQVEKVIEPTESSNQKKYHEKKMAVLLQMYENHFEYQR